MFMIKVTYAAGIVGQWGPFANHDKAQDLLRDLATRDDTISATIEQDAAVLVPTAMFEDMRCTIATQAAALEMQAQKITELKAKKRKP